MFVEGTLRWQVTEDCPWDLLMALCLRDLANLTDAGSPPLPPVTPSVASVRESAMARISRVHHTVQTDTDALRSQWTGWWRRTLVREARPVVSQLRPPHFTIFDRELELQDLVEEFYDDAFAWTSARHDEYSRNGIQTRQRYSADIVDVVREREHVLKRQAGYFRLDLCVLPLATSGAWIVAPHTIAMSQSMRDDSAAFRRWFTPLVHALV